MLTNKNKKNLIIFGRSPFIKKIDFKKIDHKKNDVLCLNEVLKNSKAKYMLSLDYQRTSKLFKKTEWISRQSGWTFVDYVDKFYIEEKKLSWSYFSSSAAVCFGILRGYKKIFLAGVDLIGNTYFEHYDGTRTKNFISEKVCSLEKKFIIDLAKEKKIKIYTLNKNNKWINYKKIETIYKNDGEKII